VFVRLLVLAYLSTFHFHVRNSDLSNPAWIWAWNQPVLSNVG